MHFFSSSRRIFLQCSVITAIAFITLMSSGCGSPSSSMTPAVNATSVRPNTITTPKVLLYTGTGTSASDVSAVESVLQTLSLSYATATASQIEAMSVSKLTTYKLLIVPGGNSINIGNGLTKTGTTNIHNAVVNNGLHYLGICAGAFFGGYSVYNGLNLTSGVWFNTWANGGKGTGKEAVEISYPSQPKLDHYWEDGPNLGGWGQIVAKYPDGTSAIVEGKSGSGWVILSGIHAEAPASWRYGMTFTTPLSTDLAYARTLVTAALNGTTLSHY